MSNAIQRRFALIATVLTLASTTVLPAVAAEFPERPIRIVVPYSAGGGADTLARVIARRLGTDLKGTVLVENKPGATGTLGAAAVHQAPADGYTLLLGNSATNAIAPAIYDHLPYSPLKDFVPVAQLTTLGNAIAVNPSLPVHNIKELVAWSKKAANDGSYGSWGEGSGGQLAMEKIKADTGMKMAHIPYKGTAPALNDVMAGILPVTMADVTGVGPFHQAGKVRVIAVTGSKRAPSMPDVPTVAEQGIPFDTDSWFALFAPANTPPRILAALREAVARVLAQPDIPKVILNFGMNVSTITPDEFAAVQRKDVLTWAQLAKASKVKMD